MKGTARGARALRAVMLLAAALTSACEDELGACDPAAAEQLVYARGGLVATKGQALVHDSCGNAAFCHSASAAGELRFGAPAGMDFDMLPLPMGWPRLIDERRAIWTAVASGAMPPRGGHATLGQNDWRFDPERAERAGMLPELSTAEGKGAVRNWLACGAPVVGETRAPAWALPEPDAGAAVLADFSELFARIIEPRCSGCHSGPSAGGLVLTEECQAYAQLLASGSCAGLPRVVPGDGGSYLLEKLESDAPRCGQRMPPPPAEPLSDSELAAVRVWVSAGAPASNCEAP